MNFKKILAYLMFFIAAFGIVYILFSSFAEAADSNTVSSTVVTDKSVPTASAPSVVVSNNDVCKSAAAASVQTQVLGVATGITITDENCKRLKLSRSLYAMGMKVAAVSTLCGDARVFDAMWMAGTPCPFMGLIGDDDEPLQPGEFRDVDAPGGAIRDSLMPLPFKGPDQTLFQLLGFVVDAGRRFATITDMKVGDGNQQAAVGTTIALLEQGSRVMSAVHKRLHYAMRLEFKILSRVMSESLPGEYPYAVEGEDSAIKATDFDDRVDVVPVSDPNVFSQAQRIALAQTKLQLAGAAPDLHNMYEVYRDMYDALGVKDTDRIMKRVPDEEPTPKDPAQENIDRLWIANGVIEGSEDDSSTFPNGS